MIYYGTNNPDSGYEFMGSFNSVEEVKARLNGRSFSYSYHCWGDENDDPAPAWTLFAQVLTQSPSRGYMPLEAELSNGGFVALSGRQAKYWKSTGLPDYEGDIVGLPVEVLTELNEKSLIKPC